MQLRTFIHLDVLQPQLAGFFQTVASGFQPLAGQAALLVEVAPGISVNSLTDAALRVLMHHAWPGNVRELENCLERAAVLTEVEVIDRDAILLTGIEEQVMGRGAIQSVDLDDPNLDDRERVIAALEQAGWVQAKAARLLDMTPRQIAYRIQTLNIKVKQL